MSAAMVYVTVKNRKEAQQLGTWAVRERLAAEANILDGMRSLRWQQGGEVEQNDEAVLILMTKERLVEELTLQITRNHSHDLPGVVVSPVVGGNPAYLSFIEQETK
ncbi:MAG: divalent-cation tolerance protein CutA [Deltaproteobacteria bacterium]|nr:divalent-cation tolerance protein CutA [Deltaproteobacteria bacterium]